MRPATPLLLRFAAARPIALRKAAPASRRFLTTAPPAAKSRSWKNLAVRLGLAGGVVYWYNANDVFAEQPAYLAQQPHHEPEPLQTVDQLAAQRRAQTIAAKDPSTSTSTTTLNDTAAVSPISGDASDTPAEAGSMEELEEEAGQQGAFNPDTGEFNWDCPCLGGMAHGPCGEEFKSAFSCFVYSTEEPKGMDCIEKFKTMQNCFRQHPDVYGAELDDDDDDAEEGLAPEEADAAASPADAPLANVPAPGSTSDTTALSAGRSKNTDVRAESVLDKEDQEIPKKWHDLRDENEGK